MHMYKNVLIIVYKCLIKLLVFTGEHQLNTSIIHLQCISIVSEHSHDCLLFKKHCLLA